MKKVITFGEIMLRLTTPGNARFNQAASFNATYGGGEANVAIALAQMKVPSAHVTRFPDNELGYAATSMLKKFDVDTDHIAYGGDRLGLYFLETGSSVRPSKIIYDRFNSAFSGINPDMIDWDKAFEDASWFHWTGITPAISESAAECCKEAISVARSKGITISSDINYRRNLWQYGKKASEVMPALIEKCDVIVAGLGDIADILNLTADKSDEQKETSIFNQVMERFPAVKKIINTSRTSVSADHNKLVGYLYNGKEYLESKVYTINPIVDRIGGGDAFIAGYIYGALNLNSDQEALEFAVAASVLKHTIEGDANLSTAEEVNRILEGNISGKLLR